MDDLIKSDNFNLTKKEELKCLNEINNLLDNFVKILTINNSPNNEIIIKASVISESMLDLIIKKEGFLLKNTNFSQKTIFCKNKKIIPEECGKFLEIIDICKNETTHLIKSDEELISSFLNAFMYYITWFETYYTSNFQVSEQLNIKNCCSIIKSLETTENTTNFSSKKVKETTENTANFSSKKVEETSGTTTNSRCKKVEEEPRRGRRRARQQKVQNDSNNQDKQNVCLECGSTELIGDYERAEVVCARCGFVMDENLVDMGPEWRAFDYDLEDKRKRIGPPITYTIHDKGLSTMIDWRNKDIYGREIPARNRAQWYRLRKWQRKIRISGATERNLAFALNKLDHDSSRLDLPRSVREAASVVYRSAVDNKLIRGRSIEGVVAASLYAACRRCNVPRTLDEIAEVSRVTKKEVGRTYRFLTRELNIKLPPTSPVDYVPRFASKLGLSGEAQSKAIEIIEKAMEKGLTSGRGPTDVAAAALYIASILLGERKTQRDVADIAGVSEVTINNRCNELKFILKTESFEYNKINQKNKLDIDKKQYSLKINKNNLDRYSEKIENPLKENNQNITEQKQDEILENLREQNEILKKILKTVLETQEITININEKINLISQNLDRIQSQTEKLIEHAYTEEEIDRIIQVHTNECVENIIKYKNDLIKDDIYEVEKIKLHDLFGENTWKKLSEESKSCLITSKLMFNKLLLLNEIIDYSGICVLITKALEVEIFERFFTNFIMYLKEKYYDDYSKYPTALLFQNKEPLYPERFTMGNIAFVLCYKENIKDNATQKINNKSELIEYCKSHIFSNYNEKQINELLNEYGSKIEDIRIKYRNPSAHRGHIQKTTAKECMDLIIDVEKLLKKMIDSFDY